MTLSLQKNKQMTTQEIESVVIDAVKGLGAIVEVTKNTKLGDCDFDSLNYSELVITLERELKVNISFEDEEKYFNSESTINNIVKYVQNLRAKNTNLGTVKNAPVPEQKIQIVQVNGTDVQFRNGNNVLNLIDPKVAAVLKKMKEELERTK